MSAAAAPRHAAALAREALPPRRREAPAASLTDLLAAEVPALPARTIQLMLAALGHLAPHAVSGRFDRATAAAVRAFQREGGLEPTGVPSRATADALLALTR
jgi:peptidoglycan hydrolase-like protein with peptidoglycan-binding domain